MPDLLTTREFVLRAVPYFLVWAARIPPLWTSVRLRPEISAALFQGGLNPVTKVSVLEMACAVSAYHVRGRHKLLVPDFLIEQLLGRIENPLDKADPAFVSMTWSIDARFFAAYRGRFLDPQLDRAIHDITLAQVFARSIGVRPTK